MTDKNDGRLDPKGPNKFVPEKHEPFPGQPHHDGHGSPGEKTDQQKKNR